MTKTLSNLPVNIITCSFCTAWNFSLIISVLSQAPAQINSFLPSVDAAVVATPAMNGSHMPAPPLPHVAGGTVTYNPIPPADASMFPPHLSGQTLMWYYHEGNSQWRKDTHYWLLLLLLSLLNQHAHYIQLKRITKDGSLCKLAM